MAEWIQVCAVSDVPPGEVRAFFVAGIDVAIYHLDDGFHATDDLCTHGNASLADGMIDGDAIECPLHLGTFDIRTGAPGAAPCTVALRTYKLREEAGTLLMEIA